MDNRTLNDHILSDPGIVGGKPRIAGRRITVHDIVVWHERQGIDPDQIAADYDLSLADIHAALAYYFDHREAIDRTMREDLALVEAMRGRYPSKLGRRGARAS